MYLEIKIEHPTKKGTHCPEAKGRPSTTAGVLLIAQQPKLSALCTTAGKPSTWFPPGGCRADTWSDTGGHTSEETNARKRTRTTKTKEKENENGNEKEQERKRERGEERERERDRRQRKKEKEQERKRKRKGKRKRKKKRR